jgi:hypothetical protein
MTVSAVNGGNSLWASQAQQPPTPPAMTDTAKLFDMSTAQLSQDMQSGTTLSSLASQDGVSSSSLISAVESDLQANAPQGAPALSSDQLTQMATNVADGTGPAGHHHGGHHHAMSLDSTSQPLGLSTSQLGQDLQSGDTLSSLASQDGAQSQDDESQVGAGQSLASLAAGAYANSATEIASTAGASGQIDQYI